LRDWEIERFVGIIAESLNLLIALLYHIDPDYGAAPSLIHGCILLLSVALRKGPPGGIGLPTIGVESMIFS
jgi:hypothetical protein